MDEISMYSNITNLLNKECNFGGGVGQKGCKVVTKHTHDSNVYMIVTN